MLSPHFVCQVCGYSRPAPEMHALIADNYLGATVCQDCVKDLGTPLVAGIVLAHIWTWVDPRWIVRQSPKKGAQPQ